MANNVPHNGSANSLSCPTSISQLPDPVLPNSSPPASSHASSPSDNPTTHLNNQQQQQQPQQRPGQEEGNQREQHNDGEHDQSLGRRGFLDDPLSSLEEFHLRPTLFRCEERRFQSFFDWPHDFISPSELARAGFVYIGPGDLVQCAFCHGCVVAWEVGDRPLEVHSDLFPDCPLVRGVDCGNKPMNSERESQMDLLSAARSSVASRGLQQPHLMQDGLSVTSSIDVSVGYDETGIRPNVRRSAKGLYEPRSKPSTNQADPDESIGIITHSGPSHPRYATVDSRLRTFKEWPPALKQRPKELAEAGFYYIGLSDQVRCFYCDGGLRNWQPEDEPWIEHSRWFSNCGFVRLVKGDSFIASCLSQKPPQLGAEVPQLKSIVRICPTTSPSDLMFGQVSTAPLSEAELATMMASIEVQEALSNGLNPELIKRTLSRKWQETGAGFTDCRQLIEATFLLLPHQGQRTTPSKTCSSTEGRDEQATSAEHSLSPKASTSSAEDLEKENRRLREERTCKICMDNEIGLVFLPCGHLICCFQCAPALSTCPLCRGTIQGTVKTYLS